MTQAVILAGAAVYGVVSYVVGWKEFKPFNGTSSAVALWAFVFSPVMLPLLLLHTVRRSQSR